MLRDNARNMQKAMKEANVDSIGCFAHTLQLCIHDCLFVETSVGNVISAARKIVGHFKHSSSAMARLKVIQQDLKLPEHSLLQDVVTRWNSTFYMFQRMLEQKRGIVLYLSEEQSAKHLQVLTPSQWELMQNTVCILQPFEELTRDMSNDNATMSLVIPAVRKLTHYLTNCSSSPGLKLMVKELLKAVQERYTDMQRNRACVVSTVLDPRFKLKWCETEIESAEAKCATRDAVRLHSEQTEMQQTATETLSQPEREQEPAAKKRKTEEGVWSYWDRLQSANTTPSTVEPLDKQLSMYLAEPCSQRSDDPCAWWRQNRDRFPLLASAARVYLGSPPTSVSSERLFSIASHVCSSRRNRLLPSRAEQLVFLKWNMSL